MGKKLRLKNVKALQDRAWGYWDNDDCRKQYWDTRAEFSVLYKGEKFYTVTPLPYYLYRRNFQIKRLLEWLTDKEGKLLDFGGGDCRLTILIKKSLPGLDAISCDISPKMVKLANQNIKYAGLQKIKSILIDLF